jgi:MoxR-like ATPase
MAPGHDPTNHLKELLKTLETGLLERDEALRLAVLAALAGEHLLLIGPPGTAKSEVARRLLPAFGQEPKSCFQLLLTRFTVPEELFGPLSLKELENDRYVRLTDGYLPTATIAFLDEIFKANSAILNTLLTILNERKFDNGVDRTDTPLFTVIAASNELPSGGEMNALLDRFLLRLDVQPVSEDNFSKLLDLKANTPDVPKHLQLSPEQLAAFAKHVEENVELPNELIDLLWALRQWCTDQELVVSDRRWKKIARLLRISAAAHGRNEVSIHDCWVIQFCVCQNVNHKEEFIAWYIFEVNKELQNKELPQSQRITQTLTDLRAEVDQHKKLLQEWETAHEIVPLYKAPAAAVTAAVPGASKVVQTLGFTEEKLNDLIIHTPIPECRYTYTKFGVWPKSQEYLRDKKNRFQSTNNDQRARRYSEHEIQPHLQIAAKSDQTLQDLLRDLDSTKPTYPLALWVTPATAMHINTALKMLVCTARRPTRLAIENTIALNKDVKESFNRLPRKASHEEP